MANISNISSNLQSVILPSLESIDSAIMEATYSQANLRNELERMQADHQILSAMLSSNTIPSIESGILKADILKKRLLALQTRLARLK